MGIGFFYLHVTVVTLFLLFLFVKTILLLFNKKQSLRNLRAKTKLVDSILGILVLGTGFYLLSLGVNPELYLLAKISLLFIAIPLGLVGLKRENKVLAVLSVLMFAYIYGIAETKSIFLKDNAFELSKYEGREMGDSEIILDQNIDAALQQGKVIYKVLCEECHGIDGKKGSLEAADLSESQMTRDERMEIITHGKGVMPGFDAELSEQEIVLVTAYTETL